MSLKDELNLSLDKSTINPFSKPNAKGKCSVNEWLKEQDKTLVEEFAEILLTDVSTMELHRFLKRKFEDLPYSLTTFRFHRNHWCSCQ